MANLPANPHAAAARNALSDTYDAGTNDQLIARAQVEATLAVAYELRTANLIATLGTTYSIDTAAFIGDADTLHSDVRARLGYGAAWEGTH